MPRQFNPDKIPVPKDVRPFEPPEGSLALEIGCGVGYHPVQFALDNPGTFLIAIERTKEKFEKFQRRYENHDSPKNLYPVFGDAIPWIYHKLPDHCLDQIFILYPNPYPKSKHQNRNFLNMPFTQELIKKLKTGASIELATNSKDYVEAIEGNLKSLNTMGLELNEKTVIPKDFKWRTHFEKKYLERNEECINLVFKYHNRSQD